MKYPVLFFVGLTAIASIAFNAHFGFMIGQHSEWFPWFHNGYLYGSVAAFLDVIKIALPIMLAIICFSSVSVPWKLIASVIGVPMFVGMTAISLSGIFGSVAVDRDTMSASRAGVSDQYQSLKAEAKALEKTAWADSKTPEQIRAQVNAYVSAPGNRWGPTNGCDPASITITQSRVWCQEYQRLMAQLEHAEQVQQDRERLREVNENLAALPGAIEGDPQARRMGDMLGMNPDTYITYLVALFAFLIEFCPSLTPVMIYVYGRAREPEPETETDPDPEPGNELITLSEARQMIEDAHKKRQSVPEPDCPVQAALERHEGEDEVSYRDLSKTVAAICRERGEPHWSAKAIGQRVRELGWSVWQEPSPDGKRKFTKYGREGGVQEELAEAA